MKVEQQMADIEINRSIERLRSEILELDRALMMESDLQVRTALQNKRQMLNHTIQELEGRRSSS